MGNVGCAVLRCKPKPYDSRHRFPKNYPDTFEIWLEASGNKHLRLLSHEEIYKSHFICKKHFTSDDFNERGWLKKNVVPTVLLPDTYNFYHTVPQYDHDYCILYKDVATNSSLDSNVISTVHSCAEQEHIEQIEVNSGLSTSKEPERGLLNEVGVSYAKQLTPKALKLYKKASSYKRKLSSLKRYSKIRKNLFNGKDSICDRMQLSVAKVSGFNKHVQQFFTSQVKNSKVCRKGRRYTPEDKMMALAIYKQSSSAYR